MTASRAVAVWFGLAEDPREQPEGIPRDWLIRTVTLSVTTAATLLVVHLVAPQWAGPNAWWRLGLFWPTSIGLQALCHPATRKNPSHRVPLWREPHLIGHREAVMWTVAWWATFFALVAVVIAPGLDDIEFLVLLGVFALGLLVTEGFARVTSDRRQDPVADQQPDSSPPRP